MRQMQLYVRGPAFGLPSIEPACIAAVALLHSRDQDDWEVIPTSDDHRQLPYLRDGDKHVSGFASIVRYLKSLDGNTTSQSPDAIAISSFLSSNAQTLLDISLYVSSENYTSTTRPAFTAITPWHQNYTLPPRLRAAARLRTAHLGLSSLDVDNVHEDMSSRPEGFDGVGKESGGFEPETQKRASLLLPRKLTIRGMLQKPEHAAAFKLQVLAENFFAPLKDILGDRDFFNEEHVGAVDYLAYGYLSLMLYPRVTQDWLAQTLRRKYKTLVAYTERMHALVGVQTKVEDVMALATCTSEADNVAMRGARGLTLPWHLPPPTTILDVASATARSLISHLPFLSSTTTIIFTNEPKRSFWQTYFPTILSATAFSLGVGAYYALHTGTLIWPHGEQIHLFGRKRFADYGDLGVALGGLSLLGRQVTSQSAYHQDTMDQDLPAHIDVAVVEESGMS